MRLQNIFLTLTALIGCVATCLQGQDLQTRLQKSLKDAGSISNVEIRMVDVLWEKDAAWFKAAGITNREFCRTFEYSYVRSGQRYRATCKSTSSTETNVAGPSELTFDGTSYIYYEPKLRYMVKGRDFPGGERAECQNSPLIAPFMFLSRQSDDCLVCELRFRDIVSPDFTKGLVLPKASESGGLLHISMPGKPMGKLPVLWTIGIDKAGDSFTPRTVSRAIPGMGCEIVYQLLGYTNVGAYQFPSTVAWTARPCGSASTASLQATGMTTVVSVRMPEQIPLSTFQVDEALAETIWDSDRQTFGKSGPGSPMCPRNRRLSADDNRQASTNAEAAMRKPE